jgi:hypothetical protein
MVNALGQRPSRRTLQAMTGIVTGKKFSTDEVHAWLNSFQRKDECGKLHLIQQLGPVAVQSRSNAGPVSVLENADLGPVGVQGRSPHADQELELGIRKEDGVYEPIGSQDGDKSPTPVCDSAMKAQESEPTQESLIAIPEKEKLPRKKKDTTVADAINSALAEIVVPLMGSTTLAAWKKRNMVAAKSLADSGNTPEIVVAAWHRLNRRDGTKFLRLDWLRDDMGAENMRRKMRVAGSAINASFGLVERGWLQGGPVQCTGKRPSGFTTTTPKGITSDEARSWLRDGVQPAQFIQFGASA